jgi:hypothetical protein
MPSLRLLRHDSVAPLVASIRTYLDQDDTCCQAVKQVVQVGQRGGSSNVRLWVYANVAVVGVEAGVERAHFVVGDVCGVRGRAGCFIPPCSRVAHLLLQYIVPGPPQQGMLLCSQH